MDKGVEVAYCDPNVPSLDLNGKAMQSLTLNPDVLRGFEAVVIMLNHTGQDLAQVVDGSRLVIDARNATVRLGPWENVVQL